MAWWNYIFPNSITASIILILLIASLIVIKTYRIIFNKDIISNSLFKFIFIMGVPIIIIAVYTVVLYSNKGSMLSNLSSTLYARFVGKLDLFRTYGINLFGHKIYFVTSSQRFFGATSKAYFVIDCLYILLPLRYGIIPTIYFISMYVKGIKNSIINKHVYMALVLSLMAIYSISENGLTVFYSSFVFLATKSLNVTD